MTPVEALQETLAAEHAAVWVYGVLGGRLSSASYPETAARFRSAYDAHLARRDLLRSLLADRGEEPVAPEAAYDVEAQQRTPGPLGAEARGVELRCAEVYAQLVASASGEIRRLGLTAMTDAGLRALALGAPLQPWPGAPDL